MFQRKRGRWLCQLLLAALPLLVGGCNQQGKPVEEIGLEKLVKGISTEGDVIAVMGQPETVLQTEDGLRALQYPKGPSGVRTWMFIIDNTGRMVDYRQLLTEENFALIDIGMSKEEVRHRLGRPRIVQQYKLKNEEVWDWRYQSTLGERFFNVHFDLDSGRVVSKSVTEEYGG